MRRFSFEKVPIWPLVLICCAWACLGGTIWGRVPASAGGDGPARMQPAAVPTGVPITVIFQQGVSPPGYSGCEDTHLVQWLPYREQNFCNSSTVQLYSADQKAALFYFDISSIPPNATVLTATLELYLEWTSSSGVAVPVEVYRVNRSWQSCQATWYNADASTYWGDAGCNMVPVDRDGQPVAEALVSTAGRWYRWGIVSLVQSWLADPASNHGLALKIFWSKQSLGFGFVSANHGATQWHPKLNVVYMLVPATGTPTGTPTRTPSPTATASLTATASPSVTRTATGSPSPTPSPTLSLTPTRTATPSVTPTQTSTPSMTPTRTRTWTPTFTPTDTLLPTATASPSSTPTASPTATASVTPSATPTPFGMLIGIVNLQGRPTPPAPSWRVSLTVTLYQSGHLQRTFSVLTDDYGRFVIPALPAGTYDVAVKNRHTLRNLRRAVTQVPGVTSVHLGTLREGDANDDNVIDILDFSVLREHFGGPSEAADFDQNGVVDVVDFSLLRANFGLAGDIIVHSPAKP